MDSFFSFSLPLRSTPDATVTDGHRRGCHRWDAHRRIIGQYHGACRPVCMVVSGILRLPLLSLDRDCDCATLYLCLRMQKVGQASSFPSSASTKTWNRDATIVKLLVGICCILVVVALPFNVCSVYEFAVTGFSTLSLPTRATSLNRLSRRPRTIVTHQNV
jgi:hypothetical protein